MINVARFYYHHLDEERIGRLFKVHDSVLVPSQTLAKQFAFSITEDDYLSKASILNDLTSMIRNLDSKFVNFMQAHTRNLKNIKYSLVRESEVI